MIDPQPDPELLEPIAFTPVPVRARRDGWTEARQRAFIAALRRIGSVSTAARTVGKTRASAYRLRERPGSESFSAAWDEAADGGYRNIHDHVIDRALNGAVVPRFFKGRQTGVVHRFYDSIALAVLSGRGASLAERLEQAEERGSRRAYFNIERAWQRDCEDLKREQARRMAAEEKLAAFARAGYFPEAWLTNDRPASESPPRDTPRPEPKYTRPNGPRITLI